MSNECLIYTEFTIENYSLASVPCRSLCECYKHCRNSRNSTGLNARLNDMLTLVLSTTKGN